MYFGKAFSGVAVTSLQNSFDRNPFRLSSANEILTFSASFETLLHYWLGNLQSLLRLSNPKLLSIYFIEFSHVQLYVLESTYIGVKKIKFHYLRSYYLSEEGDGYIKNGTRIEINFVFGRYFISLYSCYK